MNLGARTAAWSGGAKPLDFENRSAFKIVVPDGGLLFKIAGSRSLSNVATEVDWDWKNKGTVVSSVAAYSVSVQNQYTVPGEYYVALYNFTNFSIDSTCKSAVVQSCQWGEYLGATANVFENCTNLTGSVPAWVDTINGCARTFYNTGVSGTIPKWPSAMTSCGSVYGLCSGLTDAWTDDPDELMPSTVTGSTYNAVYGTAPSLMALFTSAWGGTKSS